MTSNDDGTYQYTGKYSGTNNSNVGPCSSCETGGNTFKDITNATLVGSPAAGNKCLFKYNASGFSSHSSKANNTGTLTITKLCTVTYDGNDKTSGTVPSSVSDELYNTSISLSSTTLTKSGYTHTGWNTKADGTGSHYNLGASYTMTEANITLYAEWTANITLARNGGNADGSATTFYKNGALTITPAPTHATSGYTRISVYNVNCSS